MATDPKTVQISGVDLHYHSTVMNVKVVVTCPLSVETALGELVALRDGETTSRGIPGTVDMRMDSAITAQGNDAKKTMNITMTQEALVPSEDLLTLQGGVIITTKASLLLVQGMTAATRFVTAHQGTATTGTVTAADHLFHPARVLMVQQVDLDLQVNTNLSII